MAGRHNQKRHAWRYGSTAAVRASMRNAPKDEREEYKRRARRRRDAAKAAALVEEPFKIPVNEETKAQVLATVNRDVLSTKALERLTELVEGAPVTMRVPSSIMGLIIEKGFKNQHETGTSRGTLDPAMRARAERNSFGEGLTKPSDFPLYGYIDTTANGFRPATSNYGDVKIIFKDSIKARTTITAGDSLGVFRRKEAVGTPLLNPGKEGLDDNTWELTHPPHAPYGYIEAQIHGGIKLSDIESVSIPPARYFRGDEYAKMVDNLNRNNIKYQEDLD